MANYTRPTIQIVTGMPAMALLLREKAAIEMYLYSKTGNDEYLEKAASYANAACYYDAQRQPGNGEGFCQHCNVKTILVDYLCVDCRLGQKQGNGDDSEPPF